MNKKWITAAAVFVFGASLAVASPEKEGRGFGEGRGHRRGAMAERLAEKLNLSDAQSDQIRSLHKNFREENKDMFMSFRDLRRDLRDAKESGDTAKADAIKAEIQSKHAEMKARRDSLDAKVAAVLTADQLAQWNTMKAEREARRQHRREQR
jgi:Spy/CpxP family protein refolding chaperone